MSEQKYKFVVVNGKTTYEHIVVAEKMLGRKLRPGECVHHIDHDRQHNTPDNLMIFASVADHSRYHCGAEAYQDGDTWRTKEPKHICILCEKEFNPRYCTQRLCSPECVNAYHLAHNIKSKATLKDVLVALNKTNGNFVRTGEIFGVSDNAVRKRLKMAGLPYHSKDYQK